MKEELKKKADEAGEEFRDVKDAAENINTKSVPFLICTFIYNSFLPIHLFIYFFFFSLSSAIGRSSGTNQQTLTVFCEAEPEEYSIEVTGLGGDEIVQQQQKKKKKPFSHHQLISDSQTGVSLSMVFHNQ